MVGARTGRCCLKPLMFWKSLVAVAIEQAESCGHKLGEWSPKPPHILPNWERFYATAKCVQCGADCFVDWRPDQDKYFVGGGVASTDCTSLRQPAA